MPINHWHLPWSTFGNSPAEWFTTFLPFADWIADNDNWLLHATTRRTRQSPLDIDPEIGHTTRAIRV